MMQGKVACMKELGITECLRVKEQALISALIHNGRHRGFLLPNIALDAIRSSSEGNPPGTEDDEEQEAGDEGSRGEREREREREKRREVEWNHQLCATAPLLWSLLAACTGVRGVPVLAGQNQGATDGRPPYRATVLVR